MSRELYLHAGAHRTGTSSFQMALAENRAVLEKAGYDLAYPGRDGAPRGRLRLKLPGTNAGSRRQKIMTRAAVEELQRHLTGADRPLILSEENISGRMFHFYQGRFFPAAEVRLQVLREALTQIGVARPKRLALVIRDYASLFASAYRKRAEDNPVVPFAEIAPTMAGIDRGWPALINLFLKHLEPEAFFVIEYGARESSVALLTHLLGAAPDGLNEPQTRVNLSATDAALEALQVRYAEGAVLSRKAWQAVIAEHAEDTEPRGFAAFSEDQRIGLDARYASDCDKIAAKPEVTFIR